MRASMAGGIALGFDVALFFSAVKLTTIANATVIGALQPIVVAIAEPGLRRGHPVRDMALGLVAIAGVVIVVLSAASDAPTDWRGDLAVGALFAWSAYFVFAKRAKDVITTNDYTVGAALWVAIINAPLALALRAEPRLAHTRKLGLAATDGVRCRRTGPCGHELVLQQIPLWLGSTFTLLVPVVSTAVAWAFLDEPVTGVQVGAIVLVLVALTGVITGQAASVCGPVHTTLSFRARRGPR